MSLKWTDTQEIALALFEKYPYVDPQYLNFPDLHRWICELDDFDDDPKRNVERVLEAIQQLWLDEARESS